MTGVNTSSREMTCVCERGGGGEGVGVEGVALLRSYIAHIIMVYVFQ